MSRREHNPARLLVVERDARYGEWLRRHLGVLCPDEEVVLQSLAHFERSAFSGHECEVLILSASFGSSPEDPNSQGLEMLRQLRELSRSPAVIAVAEEGNELTAVRALQLGAVDYLPKRLLTPERLRNSVRLAVRLVEKRLARRISGLVQDVRARAPRAPGARAAAVPKSAVAPTPEQSFIGNVIAAARAAEDAELDDAGRNDQATTENPDNEAHALTDHASAMGPPRVEGSGADGSASLDAAASGNPGSARESEDAAPHGQPNTDAPAADAESAASATGGHLDSTRPEISRGREPAPPKSGTFFSDGTHLQADFFPGYSIHDTLGESEKAVVYVATSAALGQRVALKVSKTLRDDAAERQFLEREYTAIAAIREPCVVRIYDYGIERGYEYLAMEYLPQGDLKTRMQRGMSDTQALRFLEQIAAALQVIHQAGVLHRDLKPPNVMLRDDGNVALIDFGLARALDGSTPSTHTGVLRGSPYYMSPEQALGEVLDARTDFYSLGIMFYEMLSGRKPYVGASAMEVLQQHVHAPIPQLPQHVAQHAPLLARLMAKSRDERFGSAAEILAAIAVAREGEREQSSAA